jgi:integrase
MMPEEARGSFDKPRLLADGTRVFRLRIRIDGERVPLMLHERPGCTCWCGGGWDEPAARTELGNILARIRAGVWERPQPPETRSGTEDADEGVPPYEEYADWFLQARVDGVICKKPIETNTKKKDEWRLGYCKRFFSATPVDEIDEALCLKFKAALLAEARDQREAIEAGADLRDERGRRVMPNGPTSIKMILDGNTAVLNEAIRDGYRTDNPGLSERMAIEVPTPKRTYLELDELASLLDAAHDQDVGLPDLAAISVAPSTSAGKVARLAAGGLRPKQIADELSLSKATVTYHLRRLGIDVGRGYVGRRVVCELLARAGLRVSELCDLKIGLVRLHDPEGARLHILDAKTPAGVRIVEITPELAEVIVEHLDRMRRAGMPCGPDDYLVPNARGGRMSRQRAGKIVAAAAALASERLVVKRLPPLPHTTPHTLRRTYISIALLANEFDVKFVMAQVGHADSKMTMEVYAQLQQRIDRRHGERFDHLVERARTRLAGIVAAA